LRAKEKNGGKMRVILQENIESLGKKGDIVSVAKGYGRNYLIPKRMAIEVTSRNMKMIAIEQKALQKGFEKEKASYQELLDRLNTTTISFMRKTSEKDIIFGSVSSTDIRDALENLGFEVEKKKILLDEPIKRLGNYTVPIKVFHEERAMVKLEVVKEGESAPAVPAEMKEEPKDKPAVAEDAPKEAEAGEPADEAHVIKDEEETREEPSLKEEQEETRVAEGPELEDSPEESEEISEGIDKGSEEMGPAPKKKKIEEESAESEDQETANKE
jgi:large subunit ribosomal protein L9